MLDGSSSVAQQEKAFLAQQRSSCRQARSLVGGVVCLCVLQRDRERPWIVCQKHRSKGCAVVGEPPGCARSVTYRRTWRVTVGNNDFLSKLRLERRRCTNSVATAVSVQDRMPRASVPSNGQRKRMKCCLHRCFPFSHAILPENSPVWVAKCAPVWKRSRGPSRLCRGGRGLSQTIHFGVDRADAIERCLREKKRERIVKVCPAQVSSSLMESLIHDCQFGRCSCLLDPES